MGICVHTIPLCICSSKGLVEIPVGQKCRTSGFHFSGIFSSESGLTIEKHMRMTSVSG